MDLVEKYLGEFAGKGMARKIDVPKKEQKRVIALLKKLNIDFTKDSKGVILVGDDDYDQAEEMIVRKLDLIF